MAHTPGPWEAVLSDDPRGQPVPYYRGVIAILSVSPERYLAVVSTGLAVMPDEWEANARLIAAAPALVASIRAALKGMPRCWHDGEGCTWCPSCELRHAVRDFPEAQ